MLSKKVYREKSRHFEMEDSVMVTKEMRNGIAIVRMDHGKVNAMDLELLTELQRTFKEIETSSAKAIVLTGTGKAFSAGVDLFRLLKSGDDYVQSFVKTLCEALAQVFFSPRPVIAAVNGHAIAGGCILACACDHRIGAKDGLTIGVTELLVGVPFPAIALEIVRFTCAPQFFQQIVYSGKTYPSDDAVRVGLLDESHFNERLMERAMEVAHEFAALPADAFTITKRRLREPVRQLVAMLPQEGDDVLNAWRSPQTHETIRAYLDRTIGKRS
jgi:enoyl-CoA hydratase